MSQATAAAPPPTGRPAAPPVQAASAPATGRGPGVPGASVPADVLAGRGIPTGLRQRRIVAALAVAVFTILTAAQLVLGANAARQAAADASQVIRIQDIKVDLLRADALATNAFLVGGLEPPEQRAAYDEAIATATGTIAAAAQAQSADQQALAELSGLVVRYASDMEVARANNRQGLPVGAAYLRQASSELRGRGMTLVDALLDANTTRADNSLANQHPLWVLVPGILTIAVLVWVNQWIARRFRRRFNIGLVLAAGAVLAATVAAVTVSGMQAAENSSLSNGSYRDLVQAAQARSQANAAKSSESLRLIARGSGKAFETAWSAQAQAVSTYLPVEVTDAWNAYTAAHAEVVAKDDAGDWDGAVALATSQTEGSSPAFAAYDKQVAGVVESTASTVRSTLDAGAWTPVLVAVGTVLAGITAAWLAWRGVSRRLEEYA